MQKRKIKTIRRFVPQNFVLPRKIISINLIVLILFLVDRLIKRFFLLNPEFEFGIFKFYKNYHLIFNLSFTNFLFYFSFFILFFLFFFLFLSYKSKNYLFIFSFTLIIFGAISNLIDRLLFGYIIDYFNFSFTYFNLADPIIIAGIILLLSKQFLTKKE